MVVVCFHSQSLPISIVQRRMEWTGVEWREVVYEVVFSHRSGRNLVNMAKKRTNVIPIIEDVICYDVAQPDQARMLALNASYFLKAGGHFIISIKANCIESTVPAESVFVQEVQKLQATSSSLLSRLLLNPFRGDHACVVGGCRILKKAKAADLKN